MTLTSIPLFTSYLSYTHCSLEIPLQFCLVAFCGYIFCGYIYSNMSCKDIREQYLNRAKKTLFERALKVHCQREMLVPLKTARRCRIFNPTPQHWMFLSSRECLQSRSAQNTVCSLDNMTTEETLSISLTFTLTHTVMKAAEVISQHQSSAMILNSVCVGVGVYFFYLTVIC